MSNPATMLINTLLLTMAMALFSVAAKASLVGTTVDFTFKETGFADSLESNVSVVDPGLELDGGGSNQLVDDFIMSSNESIDLGVDTIVFTLEGLDPVSGTSAPILNTTGFTGDARYEISGFDDTLLNLFEIGAGDNFAIVTSNIWGDAAQTPLSLGTELIVDTTSNIITLFMASLHIGEIAGAPDLGTITLYVDRAPPSVIPLPAALPLMLSALGLIGFLARRRQTP